ncbi:unnamed protein product [Pipistrellus nathusii]
MEGSWERNEDSRDKCCVRAEGGAEDGGDCPADVRFPNEQGAPSRCPATAGAQRSGPPVAGGACLAAAPRGEGSGPDSGYQLSGQRLSSGTGTSPPRSPDLPAPGPLHQQLLCQTLSAATPRQVGHPPRHQAPVPPTDPVPQAAAACGLRMKGETPVNSTMSIGQARKMVEQLKIEASLCRIKVSKAAADLMSYCDAHACEDPLITPVPTSENPFREKKFFCALL